MGAIAPGRYQPCMFAEKVMLKKSVTPESLFEAAVHMLALEIDARENNKDMAAASYRHLAERLKYKLEMLKGGAI